jgi:PIN domain nuclease of toxin-antitoxin system
VIYCITQDDRLGQRGECLGNCDQALAAEAEHVIAVEGLPAHHQDPFDRILVAQALVEPMRLMTHDPLVALYSDTIIKI